MSGNEASRVRPGRCHAIGQLELVGLPPVRPAPPDGFDRGVLTEGSGF
jgi:hypothetical protein